MTTYPPTAECEMSLECHFLLTVYVNSFQGKGQYLRCSQRCSSTRKNNVFEKEHKFEMKIVLEDRNIQIIASLSTKHITKILKIIRLILIRKRKRKFMWTM